MEVSSRLDLRSASAEDQRLRLLLVEDCEDDALLVLRENNIQN